MTPSNTPARRPLQGIRILSLALNLPGPAALMRAAQMGATCIKLEPPALAHMPAGTPGDPMGWYNRSAYDELHEGVTVISADLKTPAGQEALHQLLAKTDVLLTSFRPSALVKLQLHWAGLHQRYPNLSQVAIVGGPGSRAEEPGHDLTYLADNALITGLDLPPTLYADMTGSLMASEAILRAAMLKNSAAADGLADRVTGTNSNENENERESASDTLINGSGVFIEIALADAAAYAALPRHWGLTRPPGTLGDNDVGGAVGGAHAGYKVYPCQDGRVALAALETHFAASLCAAAGVVFSNPLTMFAPETHRAVAAFVLTQTRESLNALAIERDIPLHTMV